MRSYSTGEHLLAALGIVLVGCTGQVIGTIPVRFCPELRSCLDTLRPGMTVEEVHTTLDMTPHMTVVGFGQMELTYFASSERLTVLFHQGENGEWGFTEAALRLKVWQVEEWPRNQRGAGQQSTPNPSDESDAAGVSEGPEE